MRLFASDFLLVFVCIVCIYLYLWFFIFYLWLFVSKFLKQVIVKSYKAFFDFFCILISRRFLKTNNTLENFYLTFGKKFHSHIIEIELSKKKSLEVFKSDNEKNTLFQNGPLPYRNRPQGAGRYYYKGCLCDNCLPSFLPLIFD